jgi:hypothetical protein
MNNTTVYSLASSGSEIFAGTGFNPTLGFGNIAKSTNTGLSWSVADTGLAYAIFPAFGVGGSNLFAGSIIRSGNFRYTFQNAVYLSPDNGSSWSEIYLQSLAGRYPQISCLSADGSSLVVGTCGMDYNTDQFQTWSPLGGLYRITYDGQKWGVSDSALSGNYITSIVSTGRNFFAATWTAGVFASSDDGASWRSISEGLTDKNVGSLVIKGANLFAATSSGVWKRPLSEITSAAVVRGSLPLAYELEQNYPNPFNPSTTIRFAIPARSHVTLSVFNILGQVVAELVNGDVDPGGHEVKFDGGNLSSGVYFYSLHAGSFMQTKKLLILR